MKKKIAFALALILALSLVLTACSKAEVPEYILASEADAATQQAVDSVLSSFMQAFEEDKPADATTLFSSGFEATEENLGAFFTEVRKLISSPFVPFDAYYVKTDTPYESLVKVKKSDNAGDHIELTPAANELYCAMYVSEGEKISYMMTILLIKEGGEFKIAWVNPTDFKYYGEDARAVYEKTKTLKDDGKLIAAYISSCMLSNVFRPGGYFRYEADLEMEDICYNLFTEISETFKLPLSLEGTSDSAIYEIGIANDAEHGVIPLMIFKTSAPVGDSAKLQAEAKKVVAAIEKLSPGVSEAFDYIRFEATNDEITEESTTINKEAVTIKLK